MTKKIAIARRAFSIGIASVALTGCASTSKNPLKTVEIPNDNVIRNMYGSLPNEQFPISAVDLNKFDKRFYRQQIDYPTAEKVGTVIVDTAHFYLYLIESDGTAMRYGVGLGRAGFEWSGRARIAWRREWPTWTPPNEMIERQPELEKYSVRNGGMPPGLDNPLGARALYLFEGKVDTLYRLHGTQQPGTIGKAVSSGCVRLLNHDIIDLYNRVKLGASIVVV